MIQFALERMQGGTDFNKRLDILMEALVLKTEFAPLFSEDERRIARERLEAYGYAPEE